MIIPKEFLKEVVDSINRFYSDWIDDDHDEDYGFELKTICLEWIKAYDILIKYSDKDTECSEEQKIIDAFKKYQEAREDHLKIVSDETAKFIQDRKFLDFGRSYTLDRINALNELRKSFEDYESYKIEMNLEKEFAKLIQGYKNEN